MVGAKWVRVGERQGPSGCGWENGRGRRPRRPVPGAERGGASNNRAARGRGVPAGARDARPYQCRGHCASGPINVGGPCGRHAPRAARGLRAPGRGWEAVDLAVGGVLVDGGADPAATSAALPCRRGCKGRGISRRNSSAGAIRSASAREVPAPPSARDVQAGSAQGPAATSAALPCDRGCRGRAISPRNNSAGKIRSGPAREVPAPPSARDVQAGSVQGPAATSAALPCGRGSRGRGISRRSSSEVKSRITKPTTGAWPNYAAHKEREKVGGGVGRLGPVVGADVPGGPTPARNAVGRLTAWARAGARDARPYQLSGHSIVRHARAIVRHIGAIVHQSQPTWEIRADVPRRGRRGYFARQGSVHVREL